MDAPIRKGIDGVYEFSSPPPKYIITEVKTNTKGYATWRPKVDSKITSSGGSQMTEPWIRKALEDTVPEEIFQNIMIEGYENILIGVSKENEMILKSLDENAKIIKNNITVVK